MTPSVDAPSRHQPGAPAVSQIKGNGRQTGIDKSDDGEDMPRASVPGSLMDEQLVQEVARGVVAQVAPEEMPMFTALTRAYFADPERALSGDHSGDGYLGFGVDEAVTVVTPAVLDAVGVMVGCIVLQMMQRVAPNLVPKTLRRTLGIAGPPEGDTGTDESDEPVSFTAAQIAEIQRAMEQSLRKGNIPPAQAESIINAALVRLLVPPPTE